MKTYTATFILQVLIISGLTPLNAQASTKELTAMEDCLLDLALNADEDMSIAEARAKCDRPPSKVILVASPRLNSELESAGVIEKRLNEDESNVLRPFTLMSHTANYILMAAHNFQGWSSEEYIKASDREDLGFKDTEVQFQISIKTPLAINLFDKNLDLFAAYTVRSFWQLYNSEISSPFRESNHEPELWLQHRTGFEFLGFKNSANLLGFTHQSNGQAANLSRSWNRIFAAFSFEKGNLAFALKPWIRIEEEEDNDDNPDITDYYGHGEFRLGYKYEDHVFSFMTRNNLESNFSRGAVEFGWSFPLMDYKYLKGYIQYFSGYGESMIDYDNYVNRIGIGVAVTDIL